MKKFFKIGSLLLIVLINYCSSFGQISLNNFPKPKQFFARDAQSSMMILTLSGTISINNSPLFLEKYSNNILQKSYPLGNSFAITDTLVAGLFLYSYIIKDTNQNILAIADSIVVGDAYLFNGQSNAIAKLQDFSAINYESPFIRTYGNASLNNSTNDWHICKGDSAITINKSIGQIALCFAKSMVDSFQIPICIINAAEGAKEISYFLRDPNNLITSNFERTLQRSLNANIKNHIKGLIWFQGEQDAYLNKSMNYYKAALDTLFKHYQQTYTNLKNMYIFQIRNSCNIDSNKISSIQQAQSIFEFENKAVHLLSTNNTHHAGCHFFLNGHIVLANRLFKKIVFYEKYSVDPIGIDAIQIEKANVINDSTIEIEFVNKTEPIYADSLLIDDIFIDQLNYHAKWLEINGNKLVLHFSYPNIGFNSLNTISYIGHPFDAWPALYNNYNNALLSFSKIPLDNSILQLNTIYNSSKKFNVIDSRNNELVIGNNINIACASIRVIIMDINGNFLKEYQFSNNNTALKIPLSNLPSNMLIVKIFYNNAVENYKIIKSD